MSRRKESVIDVEIEEPDPAMLERELKKAKEEMVFNEQLEGGDDTTPR